MSHILVPINRGPLTSVPTAPTPPVAGPDFFFDPAQNAQVDGSTVGSLADLSGNGRHIAFVTPGASQPLYDVAGIGTRDVMVTDGSDDRLGKVGGLTTMTNGVSGFTFYAVVENTYTGTTADKHLLFISTGSSGTARIAVRLATGSRNLIAGGRRLDADAFASVSAASAFDSTGAAHVIAVIFDYANAQVTIRVDGQQVAQGAFQTAGSTSATAPADYYIGNNVSGAGSGWQGSEGICLGYSSAHSLTNVQATESWLGGLYGIAVGTTWNVATAMSATSTLTVGETSETFPAVAMSATSALIADATREVLPAAALSATSSLAANLTRLVSPTVSMSATSTLSAAALRTVVPSVSMAATSALASDALRTVVPAATMAATSSLAAGETSTTFPAVAMSATSSLSASAVRSVLPAVSMSATSSLAAAALRTVVPTVAMSATMTLSVTPSGAQSLAAAMSATSTLAAGAVRTVLPTVSMSATSSLASGAVRTVLPTVSMVATSTLASSALRTAIVAVSMAASSSCAVGGPVVTTFPAVLMVSTAGLAGDLQHFPGSPLYWAGRSTIISIRPTTQILSPRVSTTLLLTRQHASARVAHEPTPGTTVLGTGGTARLVTTMTADVELQRGHDAATVTLIRGGS